jgi:chromosome segregation ATPase
VPVKAPASAQDQLFGASFDFGDDGGLGDFELERSAQPNFQLGVEHAPRAAAAQPAVEAGSTWPTGRALETAELRIDPGQLAILADYGEPPDSALLSLAYAYRVFTRQRELKRQLIPLAAECERAQLEREATLAELARTMRPALESVAEFRRFVAPVLEIEQRAAARGQALSSISAQLDAQSAELDAELARLKDQLASVQRLESEAQREYDAREANAKRAEAKLKRVQIEIRAVMNVAEQKLGAQGGQIPEPEAAQLLTLRQRSEALEPEVAQTRAEFEQAEQAQGQLQARLAALGHSERQIARKKQGVGAAYQKQLAARSQGVSESELEQRAALAELARALLAARGTLEVPEDWLERLRSVGDRADQLFVRAEMQRRAIASYDAQRARQGLRLAGTAIGLLLVLLLLKLIF